jgi:glycosyltransferase involved in cell wall biosynthesis
MNDLQSEGSLASEAPSRNPAPSPQANHGAAGDARIRGESVVCIAVESPPDRFALCLASVVAHTAPEVPILVAEIASVDPAIATIVRDIAGQRDLIQLHPSQAEPTANLAAAIASAAPADVLLLRSDCIVGGGWHEGLRRAAYAHSHTASASALSNDAGILSVTEGNPTSRLRAGATIDDASNAVAAHALRRRPQLPTAIARATYLRRDALELVGGLESSFASTAAAIVDFSQRCVMCGLVHVAADDVFVFYHSPGRLGADERPRPREVTEDATIATRYPYFSAELDLTEQVSDRPLPAALARAHRALGGMSVTIDGRRLVAPATGTHVIVLETIRALAALDALTLRVVVPHDLADFARLALAQLDVALIQADEVTADLRPSDIVHRPFQVFGSADLELMRRLGERLVISHLDLISYDNPSYFPSFHHWQHHRMVTRLALALADRVVFLSHDVAREAANEQLVEPAQSVVIQPGVSYSYGAGGERARPAAIDRLGGKPFMVSIGTDLHHKNRIFALQLLVAMRRDHNWPGAIVFAGPRASHGSSEGEETRFIARHPDLADSVLALPWVSEPEKAWLIENAVAVCHPSTREGLGLMPFEAAAYGRPCIFASTTALAELQPEGVATIVPWNPTESAAAVMKLLGDPQEIAAHIELIRQRGLEFSWKSAAERLLETYEDAMAAPSREARRVGNDLLTSERDRAEIHRKYDELWNGLSRDGQLLVRPDGLLDAEDQRALLAVASRPWLKRVVIGQARLLRRLTRNPTPLPLPATTPPEVFDLHFGPLNREYQERHLRPGPNLEEMH